MKKTIQVVELGTGKVVHEVDVSDKSERQIDKVEMGMLRNMDLDRFSTKVVEEKGKKKQ